MGRFAEHDGEAHEEHEDDGFRQAHRGEVLDVIDAPTRSSLALKRGPLSVVLLERDDACDKSCLLFDTPTLGLRARLHESAIGAFLGHELCMRALLCHPSIIDDENLIGMFHRCEAMGDYDNGLAAG